jgi:hypothetical protein
MPEWFIIRTSMAMWGVFVTDWRRIAGRESRIGRFRVGAIGAGAIQGKDTQVDTLPEHG